MRNRLLVGLLAALVAAPVTFSLLRGQGNTPPPPTIEGPARAATPLATPRDLSKLTPLQQQHLLTAQRGADWLFRMHGVKGRFMPGYLPALRQATAGDNYLRQADAAAALARAARFCGEERFAARATQAVLALLEDTAPDPSDSLSRTLTLPGGVNRVGAVASLARAIHELPAPQKDLLDRSDELCRYLLKQAQADGSVRYLDATPKAGEADDGTAYYPGLALAALMGSHKQRPAAAKLDAVRKALPVYQAWWKKHPCTEFVPAQATAYAEAYLTTKEKPFAEFVFEMNDWVCELQYAQIDPRHVTWFGGFRGVANGRPQDTEPTVASAALIEGLIAGCRVAKEVGDVERHGKYTDAIERCLQFVTTLQYSEARTYHFEKWFRPQLVGGFHASPVDGNLRLDYTTQPVAAVFGYLEQVTR